MKKVYEKIKNILEDARNNAYRAINFAMVSAYWQINSMLFERIADKIRKIYIYDLTSHILRLQ